MAAGVMRSWPPCSMLGPSAASGQAGALRCAVWKSDSFYQGNKGAKWLHVSDVVSLLRWVCLHLLCLSCSVCSPPPYREDQAIDRVE